MFSLGQGKVSQHELLRVRCAEKEIAFLQHQHLFLFSLGMKINDFVLLQKAGSGTDVEIIWFELPWKEHLLWWLALQQGILGTLNSRHSP